MSIQIDAEQLEAFRKILQPNIKTHKINYPAAYRYIADNFGNQMPAAQKYWFYQAANVNNYINNLASGTDQMSAYFIYQMNRAPSKVVTV